MRKRCYKLNNKGHLGIGSRIQASTGFQSNGYELDDLVSVFKDVLKNNEKYFYFVNKKRLRSAKDKFKKGGQVLPIFNDKNLGCILTIEDKNIEHENIKGHDLSVKLLDSMPLLNRNQACKLNISK
jgi:hypothetical protein